MTVAAGRDANRSSSLIGLDPLLPQLPTAFDPGTVARLARDRWPGADPVPQNLRVGRVHSARYEPSVGCAVSHEVILSDRKGRRTETILLVEVRPESVNARWFRDDPELPWLAGAADPKRAAAFLVPTSEGRIRRIIPIRYRPGSRCVLGYELETSHGPQPLLGKILRGDGSRLFATLSSLHQRLGMSEPPPLLPPLDYLPDLHMLLLPWLPGATELRALVFSDGAQPKTGLSWISRAGVTLARLHDVPPADSPVRRIGNHAAELARYSATIAAASPAVVDRFDEAVDKIRMITDEEPRSVTSHGAFRADQLLVDGGELHMVDLDAICNANPAADVGNLLAYLRWKAIREPHRSRFIEEARRRFLDGYSSERPPPDETWIASYEAASLLKIAGRRFRNLDVHEWPRVPQLLDQAGALLRRHRPGGPRGVGFASTKAPQARGVAGRYRQLHEALVPGSMSERLGRLLALLPNAPLPALVTRARVAARKPGNRWTIHYAVAGLPNGVVGKLYRDRFQADRVHRIMQSMWNSPERRSGDLGVPRPLGLLSDLGMLVYLPVRGRSLGHLLISDRGQEHVAGAGTWLAALHRSRFPMDRSLDLETELTNVLAWSGIVGDTYPELATRAARIVGRLSELASPWPIASAVPIHKDFHWEHVVVGGGHTAVIDLDEVRWGDPNLDLAHFSAYLELLACRWPLQASRMAMLKEVFVASYARSSAWEENRRFHAFYAYTCMKIAKQLCLARGVLPRPHGEEQQRQAEYILGAASHALDRTLVWRRER